jgi:hypothetical protein
MNIFKKIWQKTPKIIKIPLVIMFVISIAQGFYAGISSDIIKLLVKVRQKLQI